MSKEDNLLDLGEREMEQEKGQGSCRGPQSERDQEGDMAVVVLVLVVVLVVIEDPIRRPEEGTGPEGMSAGDRPEGTDHGGMSAVGTRETIGDTAGGTIGETTADSVGKMMMRILMTLMMMMLMTRPLAHTPPSSTLVAECTLLVLGLDLGSDPGRCGGPGKRGRAEEREREQMSHSGNTSALPSPPT